MAHVHAKALLIEWDTVSISTMHLCMYLLEFYEFSCFVKLCELGAASSDYLECEEERKEWINSALKASRYIRVAL